MMRSKAIFVSGFVFAALQLGVAVPALGDEIARRPRPRPLGEQPETFGSAEVIHTLQAYAFSGNRAEDFTRFASSGSLRYCDGALCVFDAAVMLPSGAVVTEIELSACDTSATGYVAASLFENISPDEGGPSLASASTGPSEAPGCVFRTGVVSSPEPINNYTSSYHVRVTIDGTNLQTRFEAVRLYYHLQVSPAPPVATFDDVPTSHPFFQVIEALSASGITAGCSVSPPLYCPDSPVTRAQMAAFLSVALGLHW
jgi:hypothetical protein